MEGRKLRDAGFFIRHRRHVSDMPRLSSPSSLFSGSPASCEDITTTKPGESNYSNRPQKPPIYPLPSPQTPPPLSSSPDNDTTHSSTDTETLSTVSTSSTSSCSESHTHCNNNNGSSMPPHGSLWKGLVRVWRHKNASVKRLSSFPPFGVGKSMGKKKAVKEGVEELQMQYDEAEVEKVDLRAEQSLISWKNFSLDELKVATNEFSEDNVIGKGGFAKVYMGRLENEMLVAVKKLHAGTETERINNFLAEVGVVSHMNHPNIAKLVGVCVEGGQHIVLELSPLGSLSSILHGSKDKLNWEARYKIALGTAKGLEYLHETCPRRIIHRDIKASNILLTGDWEPQICDFGLAKWLPDKLTHHQVSSFEGTFGYIAPEYGMHGIVNEKSDVYAYGVILLELLSGRQAVDFSSKQSIVLWAKPLLANDQITDLIDASLDGVYDIDQVRNVICTAHLCIQHSPALRPSMSQALMILKGGKFGATKMTQTPRRTFSEEIFDAEEYNATRYLRDIRRHEQLAFDF